MASRNERATFNQRFEDVVRRFPDRVAFRLKTHEGYRKVTYAEVHRQVRGVALGLLAMGLQKGARAAVLSENRPEWVVAYLGIYLAGGTAVPLDPQISPAEWRRLLEDSEAQWIFVSSHLLPRLREALAGSPLEGKLTCFDPLEGDHDARAELEGFIQWGSSVEPAPVFPESHPSDVVVIIYTSGTTGKPKGVMLTQENILGEIDAILAVVTVDENDNLLALLPLQHVLSSIVTVLTPLVVGAQVTFADTLKRSEILEALETAGITILPTVPQFFYLFHGRIQEELSRKPALEKVFRALLRVNRFCIRVLRINLGRRLFGKVHAAFGSRLRLFVSGGSSFDPKVAQDFFDLGFTILQGYGLTETTGGCTVTRIDNNVIGSVGPALPGVEVSIVDPDETGVGEVRIRGTIVMKGYYKNPEETEKVLRDGWFYSGDLGRLDEHGNLFITGRRKEVIVLPSGKNIYPDELETHYLQCPFIQEIAVLGVRNPGKRETSERLHAVVVPDFDYLKAKKIANAKEILRDEIGRYSNMLPQYKRLMSYQIQKDPLPRTTTRKIKRLTLKKAIESGELRETEAAREPEALPEEDARLLGSEVGREVARCIRETYGRTQRLEPAMNLELDLGFDSMERVELLASLEQSLGRQLPEDFGTEVFTVRDLITGLETLTSAPAAGSNAARQSWSDILSEESLREEGEKIRFSGPLLTLFKHVMLRLVYLGCVVFLRMRTRGLENLPREGPFLLCPNHLSYLDPIVLMSVLPLRIFRRVFFVGASEYFASWHMRLVARLSNVVPVDPDAHLLRAMRVGAYGLRQGRILCIFPEGARSFDGELKEFKKGAAILSREMGVPIIPVGIRGTYEVWARDSRRIRLHRVELDFGRPMNASGEEEPVAYEEDTERLRDAVAALIQA